MNPGRSTDDGAPNDREFLGNTNETSAGGDQDADELLLERVLQETINADNVQALNLIQGVAKKSSYPDSTDVNAVMEVVRAIVDRRFGPNRIGQGLIRRVASSLSESPEASIRLERIWQEARSG
jgi:hypothetical protein